MALICGAQPSQCERQSATLASVVSSTADHGHNVVFSYQSLEVPSQLE